MRILISFVIVSSCFAQPLAIGIKAGGRLTNDVDGWAVSESRPYVLGPMVQLKLPLGFAVEADALYNRFGYSSTASDILGGYTIDRVRANSWQFPILLRHRLPLPLPLARPYFTVGYAAQYTGTATHRVTGATADYYTGNFTPYSANYTENYAANSGLVAGGGIEVGAGHWRVAPEVRYIRWKDPLFSYYGSRGYYVVAPQNEVQLLVGITWR